MKGSTKVESKRITTEYDLNIALNIRTEVFVKEQGVPTKDEIDEFDVLNKGCDHVLVYHDKRPVGTGRIRIIDGIGKLERICILKPYRKFGLGKVVIKALEEIATTNGIYTFKLHGQTHAEGFYNQLGYITSSDIFMEDGISHVLMIKQVL